MVQKKHRKKRYVSRSDSDSMLYEEYLGCPIFQRDSWAFSTGGEYCWSASPGHEYKIALHFLYQNQTLPHSPLSQADNDNKNIFKLICSTFGKHV